MGLVLINITRLSAFTGGIFQGKCRETGFISLFLLHQLLEQFLPALGTESAPGWVEGLVIKGYSKVGPTKENGWGWFNEAFSVCQGGDPKL